MRVLGIDPGYGRLGWAAVEGEGGSTLKWLGSGTLETDPDREMEERLLSVKELVAQKLDSYGCTALAVEELYFSKNVKTAMGVAMARGAVLVSGAEAEVEVHGYNPSEIKQSLTGNGNAEKQQVNYMVDQFLKLDGEVDLDDEADALAVALTHLFRAGSPRAQYG